MGRGKIAVQCSHAAVQAAEEARTKFQNWYEQWMREGQAKIALKVRDLGLLLEMERSARRIPLPTSLIQDKGLTQIPSGSITCLAIGPAPSRRVNTLTGELRLL